MPLTQQVEIVTGSARKQLGQLRPANTTAASIYSPPGNAVTRVENIIICNSSGSSAKFRIFHDSDGTTYDETTALFWDGILLSNTTAFFGDDKFGPLYLNNTNGNIAVRTDTANALTFTIYGTEMK